ncbi:MAG: fused MFS/spermidine synthase [Myxococcaceae bacterium]|nr:fused MFS/spermidine synthase [Myxococcaceae bacterium]
MKPSLVWLSFLTGATVMAAEMAASRLVAPYFGSSTPVWATLISVVLGGMALGAHLGGRVADRLGRLEPLLAALCALAAHLALLPFLARLLLPGATAAVLNGHPLAALGRVGLFTLAMLPPLLVLGAVGPYLLRLGLGPLTAAGSRAGSLSAASTVGSIVGTLLAAFAALPLLGTARAMALFALPAEVEVHVGDARAFLVRDTRRYDAIIVDAFRFPYVPFHLTTREFMEEVAEHLEPGGVTCFNVGRYREERAVVDAVAATMAAVFPEVRAADARNRSNTLLYAGAPGLAARLSERAGTLPPHLHPLALRVQGELRPVLGGEPLTDDHAPVELLTDGILLRALTRAEGRL